MVGIVENINDSNIFDSKKLFNDIIEEVYNKNGKKRK